MCEAKFQNGGEPQAVTPRLQTFPQTKTEITPSSNILPANQVQYGLDFAAFRTEFLLGFISSCNKKYPINLINTNVGPITHPQLYKIFHLIQYYDKCLIQNGLLCTGFTNNRPFPNNINSRFLIHTIQLIGWTESLRISEGQGHVIYSTLVIHLLPRAFCPCVNRVFNSAFQISITQIFR